MKQIKMYIDVKHVEYEQLEYIGVDLSREETIKEAIKYSKTIDADKGKHIERIVIKDEQGQTIHSSFEMLDGVSIVEVEKSARGALNELGFAVENLWCIDDVITMYECSKEVALRILNKALQNEATMEQIRMAIKSEAEHLKLEEL